LCSIILGYIDLFNTVGMETKFPFFPLLDYISVGIESYFYKPWNLKEKQEKIINYY